jgi:hypothetical protein
MDRVSSFRGHVRSAPVSPIPTLIEAPSTGPVECPLEGPHASKRGFVIVEKFVLHMYVPVAA